MFFIIYIHILYPHQVIRYTFCFLKPYNRLKGIPHLHFFFLQWWLTRHKPYIKDYLKYMIYQWCFMLYITCIEFAHTWNGIIIIVAIRVEARSRVEFIGMLNHFLWSIGRCQVDSVLRHVGNVQWCARWTGHFGGISLPARTKHIYIYTMVFKQYSYTFRFHGVLYIYLDISTRWGILI